MSGDEGRKAAPGQSLSRDRGDEAFSFDLTASPTAVAVGRGALFGHLDMFALDERVRNRIDVVFEEIVSNIVRHGSSRSPASIMVRAIVGPEECLLTVEDDGAPFNPLDVPEPAPFSSLETAKIGGLGIPLIRRLSSHVHYERVGSGDASRNRVVVGIGITG